MPEKLWLFQKKKWAHTGTFFGHRGSRLLWQRLSSPQKPKRRPKKKQPPNPKARTQISMTREHSRQSTMVFLSLDYIAFAKILLFSNIWVCYVHPMPTERLFFCPLFPGFFVCELIHEYHPCPPFAPLCTPCLALPACLPLPVCLPLPLPKLILLLSSRCRKLSMPSTTSNSK